MLCINDIWMKISVKNINTNDISFVTIKMNDFIRSNISKTCDCILINEDIWYNLNIIDDGVKHFVWFNV